MQKIFDGTEKLIGKGAQADVFFYKGNAYKVFKPNYPLEWIDFEKRQQSAVNKANLSFVKYHDTADSHIVKMDFIDGVSLESKMAELGLAGFSVLSNAFQKIHAADTRGLSIPRLSETAPILLCENECEKVLPIIENLGKKYGECLCHLDLHFLNIMIEKNGDFQIIDWMNARLAAAVFDYARTYVVFSEVSDYVKKLYEDTVLRDLKELNITRADFESATEVCQIFREKEKTGD